MNVAPIKPEAASKSLHAETPSSAVKTVRRDVAWGKLADFQGWLSLATE
jgi:hypothetical protein